MHLLISSLHSVTLSLLPKNKTISFSPLSVVLNNLWEGASAPSFEDYSNLNDLTCPFLSFISSLLSIFTLLLYIKLLLCTPGKRKN